jgi:hypothetical protein
MIKTYTPRFPNDYYPDKTITDTGKIYESFYDFLHTIVKDACNNDENEIAELPLIRIECSVRLVALLESHPNFITTPNIDINSKIHLVGTYGKFEIYRNMTINESVECFCFGIGNDKHAVCLSFDWEKLNSIVKTNEFKKELSQLINSYSMENGSDTPDFILAEYLKNCLDNFNNIISKREKWYGREPKMLNNQILIDEINKRV